MSRRRVDPEFANMSVGEVIAAAIAAERTARLAAEARVAELTEALAAVLNTSGKIVSGSPGPLYNAGFSAGVKHCQARARSTLHTGDGT